MWSAIWVLAAPVLLQQTMQACVGLVDKIMAGSLREEIRVGALDAIGVGSYIGWFVGIAMAGLGIGGQALIARAMGGGRRDEAHRALGQAIALSALWGAMVGVLLAAAAGPLALVCGLSDEAAMYCRQYIWTLALSMPACGVMMVGSMCLHGAGETFWPSLIAICVNVVNVFASWALSGVDITIGERVWMNPFSFDLDVIGIAAGTSVSYLVGAVLTVIILVRGVKDLRLERREMRLRRAMIHRIVRVGVPNFMEGISMWAVNLFVLMFIGIIAKDSEGGEGLQGAHIIAVQWEAFSFLPGFAIGTAAGALAGQYLGAGNPAMAQRAVIACAAIASVLMMSLGVVYMTQGEWLTSIISREPIHQREVPTLLLICGVIQIPFAITMVVRQGLRGVGDTKWTFLITTVSSYGVRLPAAWILGVQLEMGLAGVWIALCGELIIRGALFSARFFHGGWKRLRI